MQPINYISKITAEEKLSFARPGIQHKLLQKMRQGKIVINAELDLHGLTIQKAEIIAINFIEEAFRRGYRYIRIIHGKGKSATLKSFINDYLREIPEVLAFCSAVPKDGGAGALYVLLRKGGVDEQ